MRTTAIVIEQHVLLLNAARLFPLAEITTAGQILGKQIIQSVLPALVLILTAVPVLLSVITLTVLVVPKNLGVQLVPVPDALLIPAVNVLSIAILTDAVRGL
jgi:hypothetical protein